MECEYMKVLKMLVFDASILTFLISAHGKRNYISPENGCRTSSFFSHIYHNCQSFILYSSDLYGITEQNYMISELCSETVVEWKRQLSSRRSDRDREHSVGNTEVKPLWQEPGDTSRFGGGESS